MECWVCELGEIDYNEALNLQERLIELRHQGKIPNVLLLLQHPHIYTTGRRINPSHLLLSEEDMKEWDVKVVSTDRGGGITYHGPGQIVGYPIVEIGNISRIKDYLNNLEEVLIRTLLAFGVVTERLPGYPGIWYGFEKVAAIGLRVTRGITKHGFALNVSTDLSYFNNIVPCGIYDRNVTSLSKIVGQKIPLALVEQLIIRNFAEIFNFEMVPIKKEVLFEILEDIDKAA